MIYIVSMYYDPVPNPAGNRMRQLAAAMVQQYGADHVTVVTGRPNYPDGMLPDHLRWKVFHQGVGREGERIHNLYEWATPFKGTVMKTFGMLTFAFSVLLYFLFRPMRKGDLLIVTTGPVFYAYVIMLLRCVKRNFNYIIDVRDLWPEQMVPMGVLKKEGVLFRIMHRLSQRAYRSADKIVTNTPGLRNYLAGELGHTDIDVLINSVNMDLFKPLAKGEPSRLSLEQQALFTDRTVFIYHGVLAPYVDLLLLLDALKRLKEVRSDWRFLFIGDGGVKGDMLTRVAAHGLEEQVTFLPYMPREELVAFLQASDFGYSAVITDPLYDLALPTKVPEFLACDLPIISVLHESCVRYLQLESFGRVIERGSEEALFEGLQAVLEQPAPKGCQGRARAVAESHCSAGNFKRRYAELVERVRDRLNNP